MIRTIVDTARRIVGWRVYRVLVVVCEPNPDYDHDAWKRDECEWPDCGESSPARWVRAEDTMPLLARSQQHARERVAAHIHRTLPNGWIAYVDGRYVDGRYLPSWSC